MKLKALISSLIILSMSWAEEESPEAMDPTGDEDPHFVGEADTGSEDAPSNVQDLKTEVSNLKTRMDELLREIAVMKRERGEGSASEKSPHIEEEVGHSASIDEDTDDVLKMLDEGSVGEESAAERKRKGATKEAEKTAPTLPAGNAQAQYNEAMALYKKESYPEAERAFSYVIKAYSKDAVAKKSHYWLGECCMNLDKPLDARKHYAKAYELDKKGPNAADCLYKLGLTFSKDKKKAAACTAWKKLTIDYPNMPKSLKEKVSKSQKTHKCSA